MLTLLSMCMYPKPHMLNEPLVPRTLFRKRLCLYISMCVCLHEFVVLHVCMCLKRPEDMNSPGGGDISHFELPDASDGNQNMIPLQNSKSSYPLNHLQCPVYTTCWKMIYTRGWNNGSAVISTYCSCIGPWFGHMQHMWAHSRSQPSRNSSSRGSKS